MRFALASAAALLAVACSSVTTEDAESGSGASTEGRPLTVIKGREWASCWFDTAGDTATLSCKSTARGDDPLGAKVEVTAAGVGAIGPGAFQSGSATLDIEAGGTVAVGTFSRAAFPVVLLMNASLTNEARALIGETSRLSQIGMSPKIVRPEDLPAARPAVLKQPFDLWPAAFIDGTEGGGFDVAAVEYGRALAPYQGFLDTETELRSAPRFFTRDVKGKVQYFVAPAAGPITLEVRGSGGETTFALERPGYYTATNEGLRVATNAEIAGEFPNGEIPLADGEPAPPNAPTDPDPSCGGNDQPRCVNGACDSTARLDSNSDKCISCGADGQTYCYLDPSGANRNSGWRCNAKTRLDSATDKCVACGEAGQTYCYKDPNGTSRTSSWYCNAKTRLDSATDKCVACGEPGQTYCYKDPDGTSRTSSWYCNPGTRLDSATNTCIVCGDAGQTYCVEDPNGTSSTSNHRCNAGLRLVNGTCVP